MLSTRPARGEAVGTHPSASPRPTRCLRGAQCRKALGFLGEALPADNHSMKTLEEALAEERVLARPHDPRVFTPSRASPVPQIGAIDLAGMARTRAFLVLAAATAVHGLVLLRPAPMRCHSLAAQTCHVPGKCAQVRPPARHCLNAFTRVIQSATARTAGAEVGG